MMFCYLIVTLLIHTTPDTLASTAPVDLDQIKLMVVNGETSQAMERLNLVLEDQEPSEEVLSLLIQLYQQNYRFQEIDKLYREHQPLLERHREATLSYAQAKLQTGYRTEASRVLEQLREEYPDETRVRILLSRIYFDEEEWESALPVFEELTSLAPENLYFRTRYARVLRSLSDEARAREILLSVLQEDQEYLPAILELLSIFYVANDLQAARALADRGIRLYPEEHRLWDLSARIAYHQSEYDLAIDHWMRVITLNEETFSINRSLGLSYYQLDDPDNSIYYFRQALNENPDDMISLFYTAMVYRQLENWEEAELVLTQLFELHIGDYLMDTLMQRAVAYESLGKLDAAESDYRLAKLIDPGHANADFYLATLYDRHFNDHTSAIEQYQMYLENGSDLDSTMVETARARIRALREEIHFRQGREQ
ncbi:MAG: tetratricopeptide repeat protein [Balneolaceae bacterium]